MGGLYDRQGQRHLLFDVDMTKQAARQRALVEDELRPMPRRRMSESCAPGYGGRKRGEVVRSRTVLQQGHTHEWLGTWGEKGNGELWNSLDRACQTAVEYLKARGLDTSQGLMRLDGAYGWARGAVIIRSHGLGYLMRCSDYRLLKEPAIKERLKEAKAQPYVQIDTGKERQIFDLGEILWTVASDPKQSSQTRLIAGISDAPRDGSKPKVGKRIGNKVYELFVTERAPEGLSAVDIVGFYFAQGGFEMRLWEEDMEQDPDRWCSQQPWGQELWQVLSQHVWNVRLAMGVIAESAKPRKIEWAAAVEEGWDGEKKGSQAAGQEVPEEVLSPKEGVKQEKQKSAGMAGEQERKEEPSREEERQEAGRSPSGEGDEREQPERRGEEPQDTARKLEIEPAPDPIRGPVTPSLEEGLDGEKKGSQAAGQEAQEEVLSPAEGVKQEKQKSAGMAGEQERKEGPSRGEERPAAGRGNDRRFGQDVRAVGEVVYEIFREFGCLLFGYPQKLVHQGSVGGRKEDQGPGRSPSGEGDEREQPERRGEEPQDTAKKLEIEPAPDPIRGPVTPSLLSTLPGEPAWSLGRGAGKIPASAFTLTSQGEVLCPMEKPLSLVEKRREGEHIRKIYQAQAKACQSCNQKGECLGHGSSGKLGRRVSFICGEGLPSKSETEEAGGPRVGPGAGSVGAASEEPGSDLTPKPIGMLPIYLVDMEATQLRRKLPMELRRQQVEIEVTRSRAREEPEESIITRDRVAHRRLTWAERLARNASKPNGPSWFVRLYGIPEAIRVFFVNSDSYQMAA